MAEPNHHHINDDEIETRFTYHAPTGNQPETYEILRSEAKDFAKTIDHLVPESREKSLAMTALENAVMWANAGIARRS